MRLCLAAVVVVLLGAGVSAQVPGPGAVLVAGSGSSGVLTSTVMFASHVRKGAGDTPALDMLVLLRGEPGWYARTPRGGSVLTGATSTPRDGHTVGTFWTSGGGFTITFDTDSDVPTLHVSIVSNKGSLYDEKVDPERTDVVLVDGVGGGAEPRIETMWIDPRVEGDGTAAVLAVRKTSGLMAFVQCDVPLPAATPDEEGLLGRSLRNLVARSCDEINGVPSVEAWAGTWVLNPADSTYAPGAAPMSNTSRLEFVGGVWKMTTDGVDAQGSATHTELTAKFDGRDYPVDGARTPDTTYAFTKIDDHKYQLVAKRNGVVAGTTTTVVSPDGRTRTSTSATFDAQGQAVTTVAVYDRKE